MTTGRITMETSTLTRAARTHSSRAVMRISHTLASVRAGAPLPAFHLGSQDPANGKFDKTLTTVKCASWRGVETANIRQARNCGMLRNFSVSGHVLICCDKTVFVRPPPFDCDVRHDHPGCVRTSSSARCDKELERQYQTGFERNTDAALPLQLARRHGLYGGAKWFY